MDESESQKIVVCNERSYVVPKDVASRIAELENEVERMREGIDFALNEDEALFKMTGSHAMVKHIRERLESLRRAAALLKGEKEGEGK